MKRSIRWAIVFGSTVILVLALNLGVAFADNTGIPGSLDNTAPVGSHIVGGPGGDHLSDTAFNFGIPQNPLCPAH